MENHRSQTGANKRKFKSINLEPLNLEPLNLEPLNLEPLNLEPLNPRSDLYSKTCSTSASTASIGILERKSSGV